MAVGRRYAASKQATEVPLAVISRRVPRLVRKSLCQGPTVKFHVGLFEAFEAIYDRATSEGHN